MLPNSFVLLHTGRVFRCKSSLQTMPNHKKMVISIISIVGTIVVSVLTVQLMAT